MEVAIVDKDTIKIKGKNVNLLVDPTGTMPKTIADAVIFLTNISDSDAASSKVSEHRVVIKGVGSYEVAGARVNGFSSGDNFYYALVVDGINIFIGRNTDIEKQQEKGAYSVLILNIEGEFKPTMVSSFEPNLAILYGPDAEAGAKLLGKEYQTASKFSQTAEKLPVDMQVVLLK